MQAITRSGKNASVITAKNGNIKLSNPLQTFKLNPRYTQSIGLPPPKGMATLFQLTLDVGQLSPRTKIVLSKDIFSASYLFNMLSHDSCTSHDSWSTTAIKLSDCVPKKKSCPSVRTGVTILSWSSGRVVLLPELMCLLTR